MKTVCDVLQCCMPTKLNSFLYTSNRLDKVKSHIQSVYCEHRKFIFMGKGSFTVTPCTQNYKNLQILKSNRHNIYSKLYKSRTRQPIILLKVAFCDSYFNKKLNFYVSGNSRRVFVLFLFGISVAVDTTFMFCMEIILFAKSANIIVLLKILLYFLNLWILVFSWISFTMLIFQSGISFIHE